MVRVPGLTVAWGRTLLRLLAGLSLLAVLVAWARPSLARIGTADPGLTFAAVGCSLLALGCWFESFVRAVRTVAADAPRRSLARAFLAGSFARHVAPAGSFSGMAVGAFAAGRATDTPGSQTLGALAVLEVLSVVASVLAAATGLLAGVVASGGRSTGLGSAGVLVGAVFAATVLGLLVLALRGAWLVRAALSVANLARRAVAWVRPSAADRVSRDVLAARLDRVLTAVRAAVGDRRGVGAALFASYAGWLAVGGALFFACRALGLPVAPWTAVLAVPVAGVAGILPTPGGLGGVEALLVALLAGIGGGPAGPYLAAALLFRVVAFWLHLAVGGVGAVLLGSGARRRPAGGG
ncbi:MAG: YbhN family protein [Halobacteriaceae archaeon]